MSDSPYIVTVSTENFALEVLEKSHEVPVLVDFWAAWCAPCQMLMPVLQQLAEEFGGKFILAKLNSDEQQKLAMEYGVRSLPTLKLFRHGEVVNEMMGAQSEPALRDFLSPYIERPVDSIRQQAMLQAENGDCTGAIAQLRAAQEAEPDYYPIQQDLAKLLIDEGQYGEAEQLIRKLPANIQAQDEFSRILSRLSFMRIVEAAPTLDELEARITRNTDDLAALYQRSAYRVLQASYAGAMDDLLQIMCQDRSFQEDAGRKGLLAIFELLGDDPLVSRYRSKMSSLLY
ncbi:thioredoxin [Candidatus Venteria ishoeyi]|uniref:thioredoxin n=1 Tax=Candidatus Venteria ishoeyi TaxID=1899563 RepID=UPI0025A4DAC7|nr:thioredoxin [Candidatus Venteria ishoeyi]MDM8546298.1 thioredoxin [Candidatus Venteria ishoeyi]